jgi:hypothetical protein
VSLVAGRASVTGQQAPRARTIRRTLAAIAICAAVAGLFACYLRVSATFAAGSDGASNALEAWDLLHGNWLLHGWTLTDVSFYTTELPEYALVELARGLGPDAVYTSAAITYTLLVLAAAALARGRARGGEGWVRALIAVGIMLAPQLGNGIHVLLSQPDHVGTQLPVLVVFLLVDRAPRRWYTVAAIGVLLTVTVVADKIAIVDAAVPLALVGLVYAIWARAGSGGRRAELGPDASGRSSRPRLGAAADALRGHSFELGLVVAVVCAVGAAELIVIGIGRLGGFALMPVQTGIVTPGRIPGHLSMALQDALNLFGADVGAAQPGPQTVFAWLHVPGIALAAAALVLALWRIRRRDDLVTSVLAVGLVVTLADFVASTIPSTPFDAREMAAALPYGAVLAGRVLGPWLTSSPRHASPGWRSRLSPAVAVLALAGCCQLAALGYAATRPADGGPEQPLAGWLAAHHLTTGLGTYTEDNVTTLDSGGAVRMLTVAWRTPADGGTVPRLYQSSASWYDPRTADANFVVTGTADGGAADLIPRAEILALAGPPARTYHFESFTIMVWNKNLLTLLAAPPTVLPGNIGHH